MKLAFAPIVVALSAAGAAVLLASVPDGNATAAARSAMARAVGERMGADAQVTVEGVELAATGDLENVVAVPDPDARTGGVIRFSLVSTTRIHGAIRTRRAGRASAVVHVSVPHAVVQRLVTRGADLSADDVRAVSEEVGAVLLRRLPTADELQGARAIRDLAPGEIVSPSSVTASPAVRAGDRVRATARLGGAEVSTTLVASQNGVRGAVIRVVNPESRRELQARVVGVGVVEVIHD